MRLILNVELYDNVLSQCLQFSNGCESIVGLKQQVLDCINRLEQLCFRKVSHHMLLPLCDVARLALIYSL